MENIKILQCSYWVTEWNGSKNFLTFLFNIIEYRWIVTNMHIYTQMLKISWSDVLLKNRHSNNSLWKHWFCEVEWSETFLAPPLLMFVYLNGLFTSLLFNLSLKPILFLNHVLTIAGLKFKIIHCIGLAP